MERRIVCLLLVPCLLLTQSAALFAHSHCERTGRHHDLPHLHAAFLWTGHVTFCPSLQPTDGCSCPKNDSESIPAPLSNHDSDAISIDLVDEMLSQRFTLDDALASLLSWSNVEVCLPTEWDNSKLKASFARSHAPSCRGYRYPLFLRQCTFLL